MVQTRPPLIVPHSEQLRNTTEEAAKLETISPPGHGSVCQYFLVERPAGSLTSYWMNIERFHRSCCDRTTAPKPFSPVALCCFTNLCNWSQDKTVSCVASRGRSLSQLRWELKADIIHRHPWGIRFLKNPLIFIRMHTDVTLFFMLHYELPLPCYFEVWREGSAVTVNLPVSNV